MVNATVSHGALALGDDGTVLPLTAPVNDLLGLRDDWPYAIHLHGSYGSFWPDEWADLPPDLDTTELTDHDLAVEAQAAQIARIQEEAQRLIEDEHPGLFLSACRQAEHGHLSASLAPFLERVLYLPGDTPDQIPEGELPTLASWALDEALRLRPLEVRECSLCKVSWLAFPDQPSPYCERPYPGRHMSCRDLKKDEHFRESQRDWRREYKRLHERRKRGTLSETDWNAWRAENNPNLWMPFDEWKKRRSAIERIPIVDPTKTLTDATNTTKQ